MIQLVTSDFDGTIVDRSESINSEFLSFLKEVSSREILFTIATGRANSMISAIVSDLRIEIPYVTTNGGMIVQQGRVLFKRTFPLSPLRELITLADEMGMTLLFSIDGEEIPYRTTDFVWEQRIRFGRYPFTRMFSEQEWRTVELDKLIVYSKERDGSLSAIESLCKELPELYQYKMYGNKAIDIFHKDSSKEEGVSRVASYLGISMANVMAIGDDMNDIGMLKHAGIGVAVGNAQAATKAVADFVASDYYYKGVMEAVRKFCWEEES